MMVVLQFTPSTEMAKLTTRTRAVARPNLS